MRPRMGYVCMYMYIVSVCVCARARARADTHTHTRAHTHIHTYIQASRMTSGGVTSSTLASSGARFLSPMTPSSGLSPSLSLFFHLALAYAFSHCDCGGDDSRGRAMCACVRCACLVRWPSACARTRSRCAMPRGHKVTRVCVCVCFV